MAENSLPSPCATDPVTRACRLLEHAEPTPSLSELAQAVGKSVSQLHRLFKAQLGLTPRQYALAQRAARLRAQLPTARTVTEAMHEAGFASSGRFYAHTDAMLGMTPGRYRAGGAHEQLRVAVAQTPLGALLVASSARGIAAMALGDDPEALLRDLQDRFPRAELLAGDADYEALVAQVVGWMARPGADLGLPLDIRGTAFQQRVWQALRDIPSGHTVSYRELAARIGAPRAVRAVASACAANPLAVVIPCHRVVRSNGELAGYAWGIERKRALLAQEAAASTPNEDDTPA